MKTLLIIGLVLGSHLGLSCSLERGASASSASSTTSSTTSSSGGGSATIARNIGGSSSAFSAATGNPFASVGNEGRAAAGEGLRKPGSSRRSVQ